jgi:hypothetical protein
MVHTRKPAHEASSTHTTCTDYACMSQNINDEDMSLVVVRAWLVWFPVRSAPIDKFSLNMGEKQRECLNRKERENEGGRQRGWGGL